MAPNDTSPSPLHVPKEALLTRLHERHDEAVAAREKAEAERTASRQALLDAVAQLTPDQVANILDYSGYHKDGSLLAWVQEKVEEKKFISEDLKPTGIETTLEKLIRVFELANDTVVEVYPSDAVYSYI